MSQPVWKLESATDTCAIFSDTTGVYPPEMEIAQEIGERETGEDGESEVWFQVFRFSLDKLQRVNEMLIPGNYDASWPHPIANYEEWFSKDLADIAASYGTTREELANALCSDDFQRRAWAYDCIGGHWGWDNFDGYPIEVSESELDDRW